MGIPIASATSAVLLTWEAPAQLGGRGAMLGGAESASEISAQSRAEKNSFVKYNVRMIYSKLIL